MVNMADNKKITPEAEELLQNLPSEVKKKLTNGILQGLCEKELRDLKARPLQNIYTEKRIKHYTEKLAGLKQEVLDLNLDAVDLKAHGITYVPKVVKHGSL